MELQDEQVHVKQTRSIVYLLLIFGCGLLALLVLWDGSHQLMTFMSDLGSEREAEEAEQLMPQITENEQTKKHIPKSNSKNKKEKPAAWKKQ